jgi:FlgN protein
MTAPLQLLIDSLRHELQEYGEMLALLDAQQELTSQPGSESVLRSITAVEGQTAALSHARQARERCQRQLAWSLGLPESDTFAQLLPSLPCEYRPLVGALVIEINQLLEQVRARAEISHAQLRRSVHLMERFVATLSPEASSARPTGEMDPARTDQPPRFAAIV